MSLRLGTTNPSAIRLGSTAVSKIMLGTTQVWSAALSYRATVLADNPVAYWRLGESSGTSAADEIGSYPGTYVNNPTLGATGAVAGNTAVTFDGINDRCSVSSIALSGFTRTIECWVKTTATASQWLWGRLNTGDTEITALGINFTETEANSSGTVTVHQRNSTGNVTLHRAATGNVSINDGNWHHIVAVLSPGSAAKIYVDGTERTVTVNALNSLTVSSGGAFSISTAQIGCRDNRGTIQGFFNGTLDEVAIYNTALSATRIAAHYNARNNA